MDNATRRANSDSRGSTRERAGWSDLLRLGWMIAGNFVVALLAVTIAIEQRWTLTVKDVLFWCVVAIVVVLRYVDITRFGGRTAMGEPATRRDFARYAAGMAAASTVVWAICQSMQTGA